MKLKPGTKVELLLALALGALIVFSWLSAGCVKVVPTLDGHEVYTFGAVKVTVDEEGEITTDSPGMSEGLTSFLMEVPGAALRLVAGAAGGIATAPPATPGTCTEE